MDVIPSDVVDETWVRVGNLSPDRATREIQGLAKRQPDLMTFILDLTRDMEEGGKELAFYMFFVVYRMFEKAHGKNIGTIPGETIDQCFDANQDFLEKLALTDSRFLTRIAESEFWEQPYVLKYVVETLMEAPQEKEDAVPLSPEQFGYIFLLLKTVIDVLNRVTDRA
jgi:hypothetical protein